MGVGVCLVPFHLAHGKHWLKKPEMNSKNNGRGTHRRVTHFGYQHYRASLSCVLGIWQRPINTRQSLYRAASMASPDNDYPGPNEKEGFHVCLLSGTQQTFFVLCLSRKMGDRLCPLPFHLAQLTI